MKGILSLSLLLCLAFIASAQSSSGLARAPSSVAEKRAEEQLVQLEKEWAEAAVKGDSTFFDHIAGDDYVIVDDSSDLRNKQQELALIRTEKFSTLTADDMSVRVYGNTAVVVGSYTFTVSVAGKPYSSSGKFTDIWVMRNGRWQVVSTQNTGLAEADTAKVPPDSFFVAKEKEVWEALKNKDKAADARLLADDFVGLYGTGFATKADHINQMDDRYTLEVYKILDVKVIRLRPTMVLLLYKGTCKGTGEWAQVCARSDYISSLWVERDGQWLNLFSQDTIAETAADAPKAAIASGDGALADR